MYSVDKQTRFTIPLCFKCKVNGGYVSSIKTGFNQVQEYLDSVRGHYTFN